MKTIVLMPCLVFAACVAAGRAQVSGVVQLPSEWSASEVEAACNALEVKAPDGKRASVHASRQRCSYDLAGLPAGEPLSLEFLMSAQCARTETVGSLAANQTLTLDVDAACKPVTRRSP